MVTAMRVALDARDMDRAVGLFLFAARWLGDDRRTLSFLSRNFMTNCYVLII